MSRSLKETNFHGTPMFPLQIYSHKDKNGFYSVTAHWHEELEFLCGNRVPKSVEDRS